MKKKCARCSALFLCFFLFIWEIFKLNCKKKTKKTKQQQSKWKFFALGVGILFFLFLRKNNNKLSKDLQKEKSLGDSLGIL